MFRAHLAALAVAVGALACSESKSAMERPDTGVTNTRPVETRPTPSSPCDDVGETLFDAGCRHDWACPGIGLPTLVCVESDGGTGCRCELSTEADAEVHLVEGGSPCGDPDATREIAQTACGWNVP